MAIAGAIISGVVAVGSAVASGAAQNKQNKAAVSEGRPKRRKLRRVQLAVNDAMDRNQRALVGMATMAFNHGSLIS